MPTFCTVENTSTVICQRLLENPCIHKQVLHLSTVERYSERNNNHNVTQEDTILRNRGEPIDRIHRYHRPPPITT